MLTQEQERNLRLAVAAAMKSESRSAVPVPVTVAQWALESYWGRHQPSNNCFGIKAYLGCYGVQNLTTIEWFDDEGIRLFLAAGNRVAHLITPIQVDEKGRHKYSVVTQFATFPDLSSCFDRHAEMFTRAPYVQHLAAYINSVKSGDTEMSVEKFVMDIAPIYATDPKYATKLMSIINMPEVRKELR